MSREYVYFLSHAPIGSLCSLGSLRSLYVISHVRFNTKEKPNQKKRSCPPSQHRTQRPLSTYLGHSTHVFIRTWYNTGRPSTMYHMYQT